jgi:hypothetical protein
MAETLSAENETITSYQPQSGFPSILSLPASGQTGYSASAADDKAGEICVGVNILTAVDIATVISKGLIGGLIGYDEMSVESKYAFTLSYLHLPDNRLSFGGDLVFEQIRTTYKPNSGSLPELKSNDNWLAVMPRMDVKWINASAFKVYSSLAAGVSLYSSENPQSGESANKITFAFQVSPVGIRLGNAFAVYAEAGFGFRGMLHGGLSYKF